MSKKMQDILAAALALPELERAALVRRLSESLPDDDEFWNKELLQELDRRCHEMESGAVQGVPWKQVEKQLRAELNDHDSPSAGMARTRKRH